MMIIIIIIISFFSFKVLINWGATAGRDAKVSGGTGVLLSDQWAQLLILI